MPEAAIEGAAVSQPAYRELILGAGWRTPPKLLHPDGHPGWTAPVTLDICPGTADVIHDLRVHPLPFEDNSFDEIHAYDVLEHLAYQGDEYFFLNEFSEYWRIARPGCVFIGAVPAIDSVWALGDPGHKRIIVPEMFTFLSQREYREQVGVTPMSDYRLEPFNYHADWDVDYVKKQDGKLIFALQAVK